MHPDQDVQHASKIKENEETQQHINGLTKTNPGVKISILPMKLEKKSK